MPNKIAQLNKLLSEVVRQHGPSIVLDILGDECEDIAEEMKPGEKWQKLADKFHDLSNQTEGFRPARKKPTPKPKAKRKTTGLGRWTGSHF